MKIGPFELHDAQEIETLLNKTRIPYEIDADEKLRDKQLQDYNEKLGLGPGLFTGTLELRYISFTLPDEDCHKIAKQLKPYGIIL